MRTALATILTAAACVWPVAQAAADGDTSRIRLLQQAGTPDAVVTLDEVAELTGPRAKALADLKLATIEQPGGTHSLDLTAVREELSQAGANWALIDLVGANQITVTRLTTDAAPTSDQPTPAAANPPAAPGIDRDRPATIRDAVALALADHLRLPAEELQITFRPRDTSTLDGSVLDGTRVVIQPSGSDRFYAKLYPGGTTADASLAANGYRFTNPPRSIIVRVARRVPVLVAKQPVSRGTALAEDHLTPGHTLIPVDEDPPLTDPKLFQNRLAVRNLQPGDPITSESVLAPKLIKRNQLVEIEARVGSLVVTQIGRARDDGVLDQVIRIQRTDSRDIILGRVVGNRRVVLTPPGSP
ncbi:MAG: flagellar basal body P-ring formation chaperone FlgA [Planctomycetota bacterium]